MDKENIIHSAIVKDYGKNYRSINLLDDKFKIIDNIEYNRYNRERTIEILKDNTSIIKKTILNDYLALLPFYLICILVTFVLILLNSAFFVFKITILCTLIATSFCAIMATIHEVQTIKVLKKVIKLANHNALLNETKQMIIELKQTDYQIINSQAHHDLKQEKVINIEDIYNLYNIPMNNNLYAQEENTEKGKVLKLKK